MHREEISREYLEKDYFRQSEQQVQMSRDGNMLVIYLRNNNETSMTEARKKEGENGKG